jgi:hypothetical protein
VGIPGVDRTGATASAKTIYAVLPAYSPLAVLVVDLMAKAAGANPNVPAFGNTVSVCLTVAAFILCIADVKAMNRMDSMLRIGIQRVPVLSIMLLIAADRHA